MCKICHHINYSYLIALARDSALMLRRHFYVGLLACRCSGCWFGTKRCSVELTHWTDLWGLTESIDLTYGHTVVLLVPTVSYCMSEATGPR